MQAKDGKLLYNCSCRKIKHPSFKGNFGRNSSKTPLPEIENAKELHIMYIYREPTYEKMSRRAANIISAQVIQKPDSVLGLATGSSPLGVYSQLIEWYKKGDLDFKDISTVNLDEYCGLAPEHEQSYRYFMNHNFFDHINIDKYRTYVPNGLAARLGDRVRQLRQAHPCARRYRPPASRHRLQRSYRL